MAGGLPAAWEYDRVNSEGVKTIRGNKRKDIGKNKRKVIGRRKRKVIGINKIKVIGGNKTGWLTMRPQATFHSFCFSFL